MRYLSIWMSEHRQLLMGTIALTLWLGTNWWYFRHDIRRILRERRAHSWSVDLQEKTGKGGRVNID